MSRTAYIWFFIRRLGGVSAVTRRIIFGWDGLFTWGDIYGTFCLRYPDIDPAANQIHDVIAHLERGGWIQCVLDDGNGRVFRRTNRPRFFSFRRIRPRQLEFCFQH